MYREKIEQAVQILNELGIDMWLTFGRESHTLHDPATDLILGTGYTWHSAFIITKDGDSVAIVGSLDAANIEKRGIYKRVIPYLKSIKGDFLNYIKEKDPQKIAINYSEDNVMADGLTYGSFLTLKGLLKDTPYKDRLVSSEEIVSALRGRKSKTEIERIKFAIKETERLYKEVWDYLRPGLTEKQVHQFMVNRMKESGYEPAWDIEMCPSVFTGIPEEGEAHTGPTDKVIERGHVLNMDFGLKINDYCSDLQRTWYILREGETKAPGEVLMGFEAVRDAIVECAKAIRPGMEGREIDAIARNLIKERGFDEYPHALGHQVGREPHDGGGLLAPEWDRYGDLPYKKIEENQVYTLEPRVRIEGYGVATIEEIIVVRKDGGEFLSNLQNEIWLVK